MVSSSFWRLVNLGTKDSVNVTSISIKLLDINWSIRELVGKEFI